MSNCLASACTRLARKKAVIIRYSCNISGRVRNHMLVAGIGYSGDPETGSKFLGIVIGTQDAINSAMKRLGPGPPHVSKITNKKRHAEILSKLRFNGDTIIAICIRSEQLGSYGDLENVGKRVTRSGNVGR